MAAQKSKVGIVQPAATVGTRQASIPYIDRRTVKAVIVRHDKILLLNDGLLPGGGVGNSETDIEALRREIKEEIGAEIGSIKKLGQVVQYRDFLAKRYIVDAYVCVLHTFTNETNPKDKGEVAFVVRWLGLDEALQSVNDAIEKFDGMTINDDSIQGKLYNLKTTRIFLECFKEVK